MTVACLNCERLERALQAEREKIAKAMIFVENAEVEKRVVKAENTKLKRALARDEDEAPRLEDAKAVFVYWRHRIAPRARSFKGKRRTAVLERLADKPEPYTVVALMHAIEGARLIARYDAQRELEYICRDPTITDRCIDAYEAHERKREAAWWASLTESERVWLVETDALDPAFRSAAAAQVAA